MLKIAHRGNFNGPNPSVENEPHQLVATMSQGFDVEVDVWMVNGEFFLGHDDPKHPVTEDFIIDIAEGAWYHCKNIEALNYFNKNLSNLKYFWHQEDDYTLTSNGYIWTYPGQIITERSIIVNLDNANISGYTVIPYGICTDYPSAL